MSSTRTNPSTTSTAEVESVASTLIEAWNRHRMAAHAALFHPAADFVT